MTEETVVRQKATSFAQTLEELMTNVLGLAAVPYTETPVGLNNRYGGPSFLVSSRSEGIPLTVEGHPILRLSYRYRCTCDNPRSLLQVEQSSIQLRPENGSQPIVSYDYVRGARSNTPAAHINVYASNDEATKAMLACGSKRQGRNRRRDFIDKGIFPTFSSLHFPVGGDRMRPGLEDVLQMACTEFGIDARDDWLDAVEASREQYRAEQLRALVREYPDIACETLQSEGLLGGDTRIDRPVIPGRVGRLRRY